MSKLFLFVCLFCILTPLASAKIVFVSDRSGRTEILVMDDDGSNLRRINTTPPHYFKAQGKKHVRPPNRSIAGAPVWSPDGTKIAFHSSLRGGNTSDNKKSDISIVSNVGGSPRNITNHRDIDMHSAWNPAWSPDGKHIAFSGYRGKKDPSSNIFVIELSSKKVTQLTEHNELGHNAYYPHWSPDGKRIVYMQSAPNEWRTIYTMKSDGTDHQPLTPYDAALRSSPHWSTDSKRILFREDEDGPDRIVIQAWDKKARRVLETPQTRILTDLCWMGKKHVLFVAQEQGKSRRFRGIYQYNLSTDQVVKFKNIPEGAHSPDWIGGSVLKIKQNSP